MVAANDGQLAHDRTSAVRLHADANAERLALQLGADISAGDLTARAADMAGQAEQRWLISRRLFGKLTWRPADAVSIEAGQAFRSFDVGWEGASRISSARAQLTPSFALALAAD